MKILYFVTFAAGALIGFSSAYVLLKKKYDERSQQEINDVKSYEVKTYNIASPQNKKKTPKLFKFEEEN